MKIGKKGAVAKELTRAERNRRNNVRRTLISAAVAFVLFIALTVIQSSILNKEKKDTVYQVVQDITINTRITEDNFDNYFKLKEVQVSLIPSGYITSKEQLMGKYITRSYKVNDIVTYDYARDIEKEYKDTLVNPIEISFDISSLGTGVAGTLREGDFINIYGISRGKGDKAGEYVMSDEYTFEKVYIAAAFDGSGNKITSLDIADTNTATMLTLIISEKDAGRFTGMLSNCNVHIAKIMYSLDYNTVGKDEDNTSDNIEKPTENEKETIREEETTKEEETTREEETTSSEQPTKNEDTTLGKDTETSEDNENRPTEGKDIIIPTNSDETDDNLGDIFD